MGKLTIKDCRKAPPAKGAKPVWQWERGLGLKITAEDKRSWFVKYADPLTAKDVFWQIGEFPGVGLDDARARRDEIKGLVRQRIDPQAAQQALRGIPTVKLLWEEFQQTDHYLGSAPPDAKGRQGLSPDRRANFATTMKHVARLPIWTTQLDRINVIEVQRMVDHIAATSVAAAIFAPQMLHQMARWYIRGTKSAMFNPFEATDLRLPSTADKSDHVLLPEQAIAVLDWMAAFWREVAARPDLHHPSRQQAIMALELMIFTGRRRRTLRDLVVDHIEWDSGVVDAHDKVTGRTRMVLGDRQYEILERAFALTGKPDQGWLFPALHTEKDESVAMNVAWRRIRKELAGQDFGGHEGLGLRHRKKTPTGMTLVDLTPHDIRRSFVSTARRSHLGIGDDVRRCITGHAPGDVHARYYAGNMDEPARSAANLVALEILNPTRPKPALRVLKGGVAA